MQEYHKDSYLEQSYTIPSLVNFHPLQTLIALSHARPTMLKLETQHRYTLQDCHKRRGWQPIQPHPKAYGEGYKRRRYYQLRFVGLVGNFLPPNGETKSAGKENPEPMLQFKAYKMTDGSVRKPSCRKLYETPNINRIDTFLAATAIKCLKECTFSENSVAEECIHTTTLDELYRQAYLRAVFWLTLKNVPILFSSITSF